MLKEFHYFADVLNESSSHLQGPGGQSPVINVNVKEQMSRNVIYLFTFKYKLQILQTFTVGLCNQRHIKWVAMASVIISRTYLYNGSRQRRSQFHFVTFLYFSLLYEAIDKSKVEVCEGRRRALSRGAFTLWHGRIELLKQFIFIFI